MSGGGGGGGGGERSEGEDGAAAAPATERPVMPAVVVICGRVGGSGSGFHSRDEPLVD